jgi:ribosomal protein S18 acetylase RimI-like enzyme
VTISPSAAARLALPPRLAEQGITLRDETEADLPFLRRLYISTRWEELAPVIDWSEAQKIAFLESQFALQRHHYRTYYPTTEWDVVEHAGTPVGRIYVERQDRLVTVLDIALLPEWRGRGIGTALMQAVCEETAAAGKAVSVAVEKFNRAQTLYRRLGFRETQDEGIYWFMEWRQAAEDAAADPTQLNTA